MQLSNKLIEISTSDKFVICCPLIYNFLYRTCAVITDTYSITQFKYHAFDEYIYFTRRNTENHITNKH